MVALLRITAFHHGSIFRQTPKETAHFGGHHLLLKIHRNHVIRVVQDYLLFDVQVQLLLEKFHVLYCQLKSKLDQSKWSCDTGSLIGTAFVAVNGRSYDLKLYNLSTIPKSWQSGWSQRARKRAHFGFARTGAKPQRPQWPQHSPFGLFECWELYVGP
jgi:hypothetical protein